VEPAFGACGVRAVPDVSAVASALRWIAGHRDEALAMGRRAAEWVPLHRDIRRKAPAVLDIIERYSVPARTLRRAHTLWVPSWGGACGVAEYTAHLAAALPSVRAGKAAPDPGGVRLLHVQHEASLFSDAVLLRRVQEMRARRVPVAVTEHAVDDTPRDWEREADALVALTRHGAARLRRRRPEKRIEHLPMGCPTPVRPRQRKRGRTIGSFGFLWPHKGYWRILDALRRLPGSDLLLFSYAHNSEVERAWESAAVGLPVRRVREFLPVAEIMERLAAEADVLVLWYDEAAHSAASYAARIALATGVPVLTSRTRWFEDLENVTHQPADLEEGIARLLDDSRLRDELTAAASDYCQEHSWHNIAQRHLALWRTLEFS
jgi:glycosyltransferase involved in cell wall biosynthesis